MYMPLYEYRIIIDGTPAIASMDNGYALYWERSFAKVVAHAHDLREANAKAIVTIEISPWAFFWENGKYTWDCPGCEYAGCPSNLQYEEDANRWWDNFNLEKIRS